MEQKEQDKSLKSLIHLVVKDNGRGMETSEGSRTGIGLAAIRSKINLLNGTVNLVSGAGEGTTVDVVIPRPPGKQDS